MPKNPEMDGTTTVVPQVDTIADFGSALTRRRLEAGLTVRAVAQLTRDIPSSTLGGYFSGRHLPPATRPDVLEGVLRALGVPAEDRPGWHDAVRRLHQQRSPRGRPARSPFPGLTPFQVEDADVFFGRDSVIGQLIESVVSLAEQSGRRMFAVLGPSGSGKSSLVRAGLLPALDGWSYAVMTPGTNPTNAWRRALADVAPVGPAIVVADQLEELWTLSSAAEQRSDFLAQCAQWSGMGQQRAVVFCLRADFYAEASESPDLLPVLRDHQLLVGPMTRHELMSTITGPAAACAMAVNPGLAEHILDDCTAGVSGPTTSVLPHLSHTLRLMWEHGDHRELTAAAYAAVGGIRGSVAQSAERAYQSVPEPMRDLARRMTLRLVAVDEGASPTAAVVPLATLRSLGPVESCQAILDHFAQARIISIGREDVRFCHEAVISSWPRLRDWLRAGQAKLAIGRLVARESQAWRDSGNDPSLLLRGSRLGSGLGLLEEDPDSLSPDEVQFVRASAELAQAAARREQRSHRRTRRWLVAAVAAAVAAAGASTVAVQSRRVAQDERDQSLSRQLAAEARTLAASNGPVAHQVAAAAYGLAETPEARAALLDATSDTALARLCTDGSARALAVAPSRGLVAVAGDDRTSVFALADLESPASTLNPETDPEEWDDRTDNPFALDFSADGRELAVGAESGRVRVFDLSTVGDPVLIATQDMGFRSPYTMALSPDGHTLSASARGDGVSRWAIPDDPIQDVTGHLDDVLVNGSVQSFAYLPDGRLVVGSGDDAGELTVWTSGAEPVLLAEQLLGSGVTALAADVSGGSLVAGTRRGEVLVVPLGKTTLAEPRLLGAFDTSTDSVAISPDGVYVSAKASNSNQVRLWTSVGEPLGDLSLSATVTKLGFAASTTLAASLVSGETDVWAVPGPVLPVGKDDILAVGFDGSGRRLAVFAARESQQVTLFDTTEPMAPRRVGRAMTSDGDCGPLDGTGSMTLDAQMVVAGTTGGCLIGWEVSDPEAPRRLFTSRVSDRSLVQVTASSDGSFAAVVGGDYRVYALSLRGADLGLTRGSLTEPWHHVRGIALSPDGSLVAGISEDNEVLIWRLDGEQASARLISTLALSNKATCAAFNVDGTVLAVGGTDRTIRLWDTRDPANPVALGTPLVGPSNTIRQLAFSRDGGIAAASRDQRLWVWRRSDDGYELDAVLLAATQPLYAVTWSPDAKNLVATGLDGTARIWLTDPADAKARVCDHAGNRLTEAEWTALFPGVPFTAACA